MKTISKYINTKIDAGALYYAIFISFIVAILCMFLISYTYLNNSYVNQIILQEQLVLNVKSGINLICKNPDVLKYKEIKELNLFDNTYDKVKLEKKHWGAYDLVYAKSTRQSFKYSKIAFCGDNLSKKESIALYLSDNKKYLSISGSTFLNGTCYLPELGIKRAYIEGLGYENNKLVFGEIKQSKNSLPLLDPKKLEYLKLLMNTNSNDSVVFFSGDMVGRQIKNSFYNKPLVIDFGKIESVENLNFEGNIILRFEKEITIASNCDFNNVIIVAPSVIFSAGFSGKVQVVANEKIQTQSNCQLIYPSFLGVFQKNKEDKSSISIGENNVIAGGVLFYTDEQKTQKQIKISVAKTSSIYGVVYCKGLVSLKGCIVGTLFCEGFKFRTSSSLYENHLLNASIDYSRLPKEFVGVNIFDEIIEQENIMWVQ